MGSEFSIPARMPLGMSGRPRTLQAAIFAAQGRNVDCAIGGIPFRYATYEQLPLSVESDQVNKQQFDNENEPGEQSLSGWWRRSQDSWHEGAGALYQESRDEARSLSRFFESSNIDVWTPGEIKLLRRPVTSSITGDVERMTVRVIADTPFISYIDGDDLNMLVDLEDTTPTLLRTYTGIGQPTDALLSGSNYYLLSSNGTLEFGPSDGTDTVTTTWTMTDIFPQLGARMKFAKHRLWIIAGDHIWQPDLGSSGATAAFFQHPAPGWVYTDIADGPAAVYFSGSDGASSSIQMVTLDDDGGIPTPSGARTAATLPQGEFIQKIEVLAGQFIGIGTNQGFRMGLLNPDGTITYGPRFLAPDDVLECTAMATDDRFFIVAFRTDGGVANVYRVDSSMEVADGEFAYAADVEFDSSGYMTSIGAWRGRVFGSHSDLDFRYQHATELCASGTLTTGRIRFRTTEPKVFRFLSMEIQPLHGSIQLTGFQETNTEFDLATFSVQDDVVTEDVRFPDTLGPQKQIALKFLITRDASDATLGPIINSYLIRSLPAIKPRRVFQLPLMCWDFEVDKSGHAYGQDGFGLDRMNEIQSLEDTGDFLLYEDMSGMSSTGRQVQIDSTRFIMQHPPAQGFSGWGGFLIVTLKTVD